MNSRKQVRRLSVFGLALFVCGMLVWAHSVAVLLIPDSWVPSQLRYLGKTLLVMPADDVAIACFAIAWVGYLIWAWASRR